MSEVLTTPSRIKVRSGILWHSLRCEISEGERVVWLGNGGSPGSHGVVAIAPKKRSNMLVGDARERQVG